MTPAQEPHGGASPPLIDPLAAIQRGLEDLYRVETNLNIRDFLLTGEQRATYFSGRAPAEQLLLRESEDGLDLALYLSAEALAALDRNDPRQGVSEANLQHLLLVVEGVSHFIYTVDRARSERPFSALELELQAEVDKYVALVLLTWDAATEPAALIHLLFHHVSYHPDLSPEERDRYVTANAHAGQYAGRLAARYLHQRALPEFLVEVRRFWRLSFAGKLSHIIDRL